MVESFETKYLASPQEFLQHRLRYYQDTTPIPIENVAARVFPKSFYGYKGGEYLLSQRQRTAETLEKLKPEIVIITAAKNRMSELATIYDSLSGSKGGINWSWVVVDNGSNDDSLKYLEYLKDERVLPVSFVEQTGCAYPVRNFGLDLVHYSLYRTANEAPYIMVLDSDDNPNNEYSLHELADMRSAATGSRLGRVLLHGFSITNTKRTDTMNARGTEPHNISSSFPKVNKLSEVFDKGLNILSGCFPVECLDWLRYPPESSFEDNGFNHKLLLQGRKMQMMWLAKEYPITTKNLLPDCMSTQNDKRGDQLVHANIGEYTTTGMRAVIVGHLKYLTDYFHIEGL